MAEQKDKCDEMAELQDKREENREDEEGSDGSGETTDDDEGTIFLQILNTFPYNFGML